MFRISFGGNNDARSQENQPLKQMALHAKKAAFKDDFDNLTDSNRQFVMYSWLADELDEQSDDPVIDTSTDKTPL